MVCCLRPPPPPPSLAPSLDLPPLWKWPLGLSDLWWPLLLMQNTWGDSLLPFEKGLFSFSELGPGPRYWGPGGGSCNALIRQVPYGLCNDVNGVSPLVLGESFLRAF